MIGGRALSETFSAPPEAPEERAAHVRYRGDGSDDTAWSCAVEACFQGANVSVLRDGGGVRVRHGARAIAFDAELPRDVRAALEAAALVRYRLPHLRDLHTALQGGLLLVHAGDVVLDDESLRRERLVSGSAYEATGRSW